MITYYNKDNGLIKIDQWVSKCWVNVEVPNEDDKKYLIEELGVPEAFYNDIEDLDERPRIEMEDGWLFIILRIPLKAVDSKIPYSTIPLGLLLKDDVFVSVCFQKTEVISDIVEFVRRKGIQIKDNFDFILRLILSSSVWFLKYLKQINQNIKLAETKLESSIKNEDLQTLLQIEKCLVFFTTSLKGNDILVHRLKKLKGFSDEYDLDLLEDVSIELNQALDMTKIYSDILSGMMDAYASVISNNLNILMKKLTSISIIIMIPTLIASLYGMNVPNSLQDKPYGFFVIVAGSFALAGAGILLFVKQRLF